MAAAFETTIKIFGGLDILVANAGTERKYAPIENLKFEDFESVLRINVIGVWLSMKYAVEQMMKRVRGSIVALSSTSEMVGSPTMATYIASKHAVSGLVKTAAFELAAINIRVNAIGPSAIDNRIFVRLNLNLVRRIRTLGKILFPTIYQWVGMKQMKRLPILHYSWLTTNQPTA